MSMPDGCRQVPPLTLPVAAGAEEEVDMVATEGVASTAAGSWSVAPREGRSVSSDDAETCSLVVRDAALVDASIGYSDRDDSDDDDSSSGRELLVQAETGWEVVTRARTLEELDVMYGTTTGRLHGRVDVMGPSSAMKTLISSVYSQKAFAVPIHHLGNTLVLEDPITEDIPNVPLGLSTAQHELQMQPIASSAFREEAPVMPSMVAAESEAQADLLSRFVDRTRTTPGAPTAMDDGFEAQQAVVGVSSIADEVMPKAPRQFRQVTRWGFGGKNMVLGSDLLTFGNDAHPLVSLRLQDVSQSMTQSQVMDLYLDNRMANVPTTAFCFHEAGVVRNYKLVATEELPHLGDAPFRPDVLELNARTLLSFLQENCRVDGGTYWLVREAGDKLVKLYDLTALVSQRADKWKYMMAMLCYRYASQLGKRAAGPGSPATPDAMQRLRDNMRRQELLLKCNSLLEELGNHGAIQTNVHERLAESYLEAADAATEASSAARVGLLNRAAKHLLLGIQSVHAMVETEIPLPAVSVPGTGGGAGTSVSGGKSEDLAPDLSATTTRLWESETGGGVGSGRSAASRCLNPIVGHAAEQLKSLQHKLFIVTMDLCRHLSGSGRPDLALRAANDCLGIASLAPVDAVGDAACVTPQQKACLLDACGDLCLQQSQRLTPAAKPLRMSAPTGVSYELSAQGPAPAASDVIRVPDLPHLVALIVSRNPAVDVSDMKATEAPHESFLFLAVQCYQCALVWFQELGSSTTVSVARRLGDALNRWAQALLAMGDTMSAASAFSRGADVFLSIKDTANAALLQCNISHLLRFMALTCDDVATTSRVLSVVNPDGMQEKRATGVGQAAMLESALEVCKEARKHVVSRKNPDVWAKVTEEFAQVSLSYGVCLARSLKQSDVTPGSDLPRKVTQLLTSAHDLYQSLGIQEQVAACQYQLGNFHRCCLEDTRFRPTTASGQELLATTASALFEQALQWYTEHPSITLVIVVMDLVRLIEITPNRPTAQFLRRVLGSLSAAHFLFARRAPSPAFGQPEVSMPSKADLAELAGVAVKSSERLLHKTLALGREQGWSDTVMKPFKDSYLVSIKAAPPDVHMLLKALGTLPDVQ